MALESELSSKHIESIDSSQSAAVDEAMPLASDCAMRALFTHCSDNLVIVDDAYQVLHATMPLARTWGMSTVEIIGLNIVDIFDQGDNSLRLDALIDRALSGESVTHSDWQVLPTEHIKKNQKRHIRYELSPHKTSAGKIEGAVIRVVDITEQRQTEEQLQLTQKRLDDFVDATTDWLWEMDSELRFVWISRDLDGLFHFDRTEMYGKRRTAHPANTAEADSWERHQKTLQNREPFRDFDYRASTPVGYRWLRVSGVPVFNEHGAFTGYRGSGCDYTEIKTIEDQALRAESTLTKALDEYPGSIALYNSDQSLHLYNKKFVQVNESLGDLLRPGLNYTDCVVAQLSKGVYAEIEGQRVDDHSKWAKLIIEQKQGSPLEIKCTDGSWVRLSKQPLPDNGCLETLVDITNEKNSELLIKEERNLFKALIDNIPDLIYVKDKHSRFILQNRALQNIMRGVSKANNKPLLDNYEGSTDYDYYSEDIAQPFREEEMAVIDHGTEIVNKEEFIENNGSGDPLWISTYKAQLKDTEGRVIGLVGTGRLINEQKEAQEELLCSQARFRDFAETAAELFWETGAELEITWLSEHYEKLTGQAPQFTIGLNLCKLLARQGSTAIDIENLRKCLQRQEPFSDVQITFGQTVDAERHILLSGKPCFSTSGKFNGYRGTGRDVTKARKLEQRLSYQATHDDLTDLPNRRAFIKLLVTTLENKNSGTVVGYLDLDQFKVVNDSAGHQAGDQLLVQIGEIISKHLGENNTVARLGGDEFGLLLMNSTGEKALESMQGLIKKIDAFRFAWDHQIYGMGASIGLVVVDDEELDASGLLARADVACFAAKDNGRGRVHVYSEGDTESAARHRELLMAASIRDTIANNQFFLHAQPIVSFADPFSSSLQVEHYEILVRMQAGDGSLIYPGAFIPAAERYGLMIDIDKWVISNTFCQMQEHAYCDEIRVTVNLSGQTLSDETLAEFVMGELHKYQITPARICFEITETAVIQHLTRAQEFVQQMTEVGCTFALDDFGTGMSSFGYLKNFQVDYLKIDGSFVRDIVDNKIDQLMASSINQIGQSLGMKTIAECVENDAIVTELRAIGVDMLQGYGIGRPAPFEDCFADVKNSKTAA